MELKRIFAKSMETLAAETEAGNIERIYPIDDVEEDLIRHSQKQRGADLIRHSDGHSSFRQLSKSAFRVINNESKSS